MMTFSANRTVFGAEISLVNATWTTRIPGISRKPWKRLRITASTPPFTWERSIGRAPIIKTVSFSCEDIVCSVPDLGASFTSCIRILSTVQRVQVCRFDRHRFRGSDHKNEPAERSKLSNFAQKSAKNRGWSQIKLISSPDITFRKGRIRQTIRLKN